MSTSKKTDLKVETTWHNIYSKFDDLDDYYEITFQNHDMCEWIIQYLSSIESSLSKDIKSILDIGCATGKMLSLFRGKDRRLVGVDYSQNFIQKARSSYSDIEFRELSAYELAKLNEKFDLILCFNLFQNLSDPAKALKEIKRCLSDNPNAKAIVMTSYQYSISRYEWVSRLLGVRQYDMPNISRFSCKSMKKLAKSEGLSVISARPISLLPKHFSYLNKLSRYFPFFLRNQLIVEFR